jgi:hypothetical protein
MASEPPVELDRERDLGDLLTVSFGLFTKNFTPLFTLAIIAVAPYVLLIDGVWGRSLAEGPDADLQPGVAAVYALTGALVVQPLVTVFVVRYTEALRAGRQPDVGEALRDGLPFVIPAAAAILLATLGVAAGFLLLIIPGIWLGVRWIFAAQAVVLAGERGAGALRRSAGIVDGQWWATFGRLLVLNLVGTAIALLLGIPAAAVDDGVVYVVLQTIGTAASVAYTALALTLLFYDRRRRSAAVESAA